MSNQLVESDKLDYQRATQNEPLTDRDIQLIHRYLSDPQVFPKEFKNWVTQHSSDTVDIAKSQVHGLINGSGQVVIGGGGIEQMGLVFCGFCFPYAGGAAPPGWELCDGRELVRTDYANLFNAIGTLWGTPSGGTVFKLPDLRDRSVFGAGGSVLFAGNEGGAVGVRGPRHFHRVYDSRAVTVGGTTGVEGQNHGHNVGAGRGFASGGIQGIEYPGGGAVSDGVNANHSHSFSGTGTHTIDVNTYGDSGMQGVIGYAGLNYIIGSGKLAA